MCDPVTLTVTAAVVGAAGTVYAGVQQSRMHRYQAGVARNNAVYAQREADDAIERGQQEEIRHYQALARLRGEQNASYAAMGLDTTFGTPLDMLADTTQLGNEDAYTMRLNAARESQGFRIEAANYEAEDRAQRAAGKTALVNAGISATGTLLGGASQAYGMAKQYGAPAWAKRMSRPSGGRRLQGSFQPAYSNGFG
jgi:hypothetical protein